MNQKTQKYKNPVLVNTEAMAQQFPDTFEIPDGRDALTEGDYAKVSCADERFWCVIRGVTGGIYYGEVNNNLVLTERHGLILGDRIKFAPCNIYQIDKS